MTKPNKEQKANELEYKLLRPILFDGEEVTSLTFDFEKLTGQDLIACASQAKAIAPDEYPLVLAVHMPYQITVAAKAAGVPAELIQALKAKDFTQVTQRAQNFLLVQE